MGNEQSLTQSRNIFGDIALKEADSELVAFIAIFFNDEKMIIILAGIRLL